MFVKKQAIGKLYELRGIIAGMIAGVNCDAVTFDQAFRTITAYCVAASEENYDKPSEEEQAPAGKEKGS